MKTKTILISLIFLIGLISSSVMADQVYVGLAISPVPGQPNYESDGILNGTAAYETSSGDVAGWRFSYTGTNFKHSDTSTTKLHSHILAAETMFVGKIRSGLSLIGAIGPALFRTTAEVKNIDDKTDWDIGLSATGSLRFALNDTMFTSVAFHYKNCAVSSDNSVYDGGYQAFFVNFGFFF